MKKPKFKELPVIVKEVFCRVGQSYNSGNLFINYLSDLNSEIAYLAAKELNIRSNDLHNLTCIIEKSFSQNDNITSITGDDYLAKKVLKLKVRITIEECELIDDMTMEKEIQ